MTTFSFLGELFNWLSKQSEEGRNRTQQKETPSSVIVSYTCALQGKVNKALKHHCLKGCEGLHSHNLRD